MGGRDDWEGSGRGRGWQKPWRRGVEVKLKEPGWEGSGGREGVAKKPWRRGAEVKLKEPGWEGSGGGRGWPKTLEKRSRGKAKGARVGGEWGREGVAKNPGEEEQR